MAKFRFRLEMLLRLRCSQRDQRRGELAEAHQAAEILQQRHAKLETELEEIRRQRAVSAGTVDVDALIEATRYQFHLSSQRQLLEEQSSEVSAEIDRRRQKLVAADQEVRTLEKLREKQQQRHDHEVRRREVSEMDEAAGRMGQSLLGDA